MRQTTLALEIRKEFEKRRLKNPRFSLRSFAQKLEVSPSVLSEILMVKRKVSDKYIERLGKQLLWDEEKIERIKSGSARPRTMQNEVFDLVCEWYHFAILSLAETKSYQSSPEYISDRLNISKTKAEQAVQLLQKLGFLDAEGRLSENEPVHTLDDVPSVAIKRNHIQAMELAEDALLAVDIENREFAGVTLAINHDQLAEYKKVIRQFRGQIESLAQAQNIKTKVYRLNIHFFPLERRGK